MLSLSIKIVFYLEIDQFICLYVLELDLLLLLLLLLLALLMVETRAIKRLEAMQKKH